MTGIVSADPSCQPSPFDAIRRTRDDGTEYWLGRELQAVVEYSRWEDFAKLIERARVSAANTGADVDRAFSVITEKGAGRPRTDVEVPLVQRRLLSPRLVHETYGRVRR